MSGCERQVGCQSKGDTASECRPGGLKSIDTGSAPQPPESIPDSPHECLRWFDKGQASFDSPVCSSCYGLDRLLCRSSYRCRTLCGKVHGSSTHLGERGPVRLIR